MHFQNQIAQSFVQIRFALPNAAPADAVQVRFVDKTTKRTPAVRFVLVDVIERKTGIETTTPADLDATDSIDRQVSVQRERLRILRCRCSSSTHVRAPCIRSYRRLPMKARLPLSRSNLERTREQVR